MAEEIDLKKCNFRNFRSPWPRPWPYVRTYWRTVQTPLMLLGRLGGVDRNVDPNSGMHNLQPTLVPCTTRK